MYGAKTYAKDGCACSLKFVSEDMRALDSALYGHYGENIIEYTPADLSKIRMELRNAEVFKSEVDADNVIDFFNQASDKVMTMGSAFKTQLCHLSNIIDVLGDQTLRDSIKFDTRKMADVLSQILIALKLLANEPTMTNLVLVFTSCISKLELPYDKMKKYIDFIKSALQTCIAAISSVGFKSENAFTEMVNSLTSFCGEIKNIVDDKVIDIVLSFLAKCVAFWTTLSGGFPEELLDVASIPKIVEKIRGILAEGGDILEGLLGGYEWMIDNFPKFYKGDYRGLWFGKDETRVFEAQVSECKKIFPLICSGAWDIVKEQYNLTESSYNLKVSELIKTAKKMMKTAKPSQMPGFKRCLDELIEVQVSQHMKKAQVQSKMTAVGICFVGPSGVGKSLLMEQTSKCLISASGEVPTKDTIVTGQMSDKFDSNELPQHLSIQYDDVGNNSNNENFDKLLNAVNSQSRPFLKAGVDEKGTMFPGNVACVISTNVPGLNAHKSNCPDSIARRFLHIEVKIKESLISEICVPGTKRVDAIKATTEQGEPRMDIWEFKVYEFITFDVPTDQDEFPEGCILWEGMLVRPLMWTDKPLEEQTYWDLARFLTLRAKKHFKSQTKALEAMRSRQEVAYCEECHLPENVCPCCEGAMSEWFTAQDFDTGLHVVADAYDSIYWMLHDNFDTARWRLGLYAITILAPLDMQKRLIRLGLPIFTLLACVSSNHALNVTITVFLLIVIYLIQVYVAYRRVQRRLSNTYGAIAQLAEDTCAAARRHRNAIFAGAGMISFMYLIYRTFRPKSEMMSYQESLPESLRSAFARREKAKTTPLDQILPHIKKDIGKLTVFIEGKNPRHCLVFPIEANFYVSVGHIFPKKGDFTIEIRHDDSLTPTAAKQKLSVKHIHRFEDKDLVLFQVPSAAPRRGYKDFLIGRSVPLGTQYIKLVTLDLSTLTRQVADTRMEPAYSMFRSSVRVDNEDGGVTVYQPYKYDSPIGTRSGMCGSVVVDYSQSIIYGFHVAGTGKVGLMSTLCSTDIDEALKKFKGFIPLNQGELQMGSQSLLKEPGLCNMSVGDPEHDKPLEEHNCRTEGVLPEGGAKFSSPYLKHPFIETVTQQFGPYKFGPPQDINCDFHKRKALTKLTSPNQEFALDELDCVVNDYMSPVIKMIRSMKKSERDDFARKLSVQEALDGTGEPSLGGINNSTSCGYPFKGKKKNFLKADPLDPTIPMTPRELVEYNGVEMLEEVEEMKIRYLSGLSCRPLFKCSMKTNELLPVNKKKARIFMGSNFPFLILCRQYLAPVIRLISKNKFLFETAKGINMDSIEAEQLYRFIKVQDGRQVVALDYSAYDQTMSAQVTNAVAGMIIDMMRELGCDEEHINISRGLLTDIIYPNLHFFGTVIQLANSDPSGNPITTELNGMVNSLYLRCFFFRIYPQLKGKVAYRSAIKTMTYGDDNISGVHTDYSDFNGENIVAEGKKVGLKITMADKDADIVKFTAIEDSDFLKRKFRFCPDLGYMRAPLAKSSITKSLYWMKKDSPEPPEILFAQNVDGGLRKASQHGREYFEEVRQKFLIIANTHQCAHLIKWWTYDELIEHDRVNYYEDHVCHHVHPGLYGDIKELKGLVSEARSKKNFTLMNKLIMVGFAACYMTSVTVLFCRAIGLEKEAKEALEKSLWKLVRLSSEARQSLSVKLEEAYALNGWRGVLELVGFPLALVDYMKTFTVNKDIGEFGSEFKSEYFEEPTQPKISRRTTMLTALHDVLDTVMSLRPFLLTGRGYELGLSQWSFMSIIMTLLSIRSLFGVKKEDGIITTGLNIVTKEARRLLADMYLRVNNQLVRKQAFCIYLEGAPGCGKTFATLVITKHLIPNLKKHEMIVLNEEDQFQSELRSYHRVIMMDDVGNTRVDREQMNPLRRPLDFVNNTPRRALNPEADLKGCITINPELVFLTSNVAAPKLAFYHSECPSSLYRRWLRVKLVKNGTFNKGLDIGKWTFHVYDNIVPRPSEICYGVAEYSNIPTLMTTEEFLGYVEEQYVRHNENQEKVVNGVNEMFKSKSRFQAFKELFIPMRFKSESYERQERIMLQMESYAQILNDKNFVDILKYVADQVDIEMKQEEAKATIPNITWWSYFKTFLGIQPRFRSEAFHRYACVDDLNRRQQDALVDAEFGNEGHIICKDYVCSEKFSRAYPLSQKGYNILAKMMDAYIKHVIIVERMVEFYDYEITKEWIEQIRDRRRMEALEDAVQRELSLLEANPDGFVSEAYEETIGTSFRNPASGPLDRLAEDKRNRKIIEAYVSLYGLDHISTYLMEHNDDISRRRLQQMLISDELDEALMNHQPFIENLKDLGSYDSDLDDSKDISACDDDRTTTPLKVGKVGADFTGFASLKFTVPSTQEFEAHKDAARLFLKQNPSYRIVAHECVIEGVRIDLLFSDGHEYIILEAKHRGVQKVKAQAQAHCLALARVFPIVKAAYYVSSQGEVKMIDSGGHSV